MGSPAADYQKLKDLMAEAKGHIANKDWKQAIAVLDAAVTLDTKFDHPHDLLAVVYDNLNEAEKAQHQRQIAKNLRKEHWEREVEADIRSHHDMMGEMIRHEIP